MNDLLTGQDALIARLEDENARLRRELAAKDGEIRAVESQNAAAVKNLKRALNPLYTALRQIFGEIDVLVSPEESTVPVGTSPTIDRRVAAVWDDWKRRYPGKTADVIDALLLHGEKNTTQLSILAHTSKGNITNIVGKLTQLGLINKNGGRFSLKPL